MILPSLKRVLCFDGTFTMANVYIRPNCSRKKIVKNGDWVEYQKTKKKNDKTKKNTRQDSSAQQLEQVADFAGNSYKEYQGQGNAYI